MQLGVTSRVIRGTDWIIESGRATSKQKKNALATTDKLQCLIARPFRTILGSRSVDVDFGQVDTSSRSARLGKNIFILS